jgi:hypothetical protein
VHRQGTCALWDELARGTPRRLNLGAWDATRARKCIGKIGGLRKEREMHTSSYKMPDRVVAGDLSSIRLRGLGGSRDAAGKNWIWAWRFRVSGNLSQARSEPGNSNGIVKCMSILRWSNRMQGRSESKAQSDLRAPGETRCGSLRCGDDGISRRHANGCCYRAMRRRGVREGAFTIHIRRIPRKKKPDQTHHVTQMDDSSIALKIFGYDKLCGGEQVV